MHYQWNYEPPTPERQQAANELAEKIGMSPIVADLLIVDPEKAYLSIDNILDHNDPDQQI